MAASSADKSSFAIKVCGSAHRATEGQAVKHANSSSTLAAAGK
jgi:hypothetical protein